MDRHQEMLSIWQIILLQFFVIGIEYTLANCFVFSCKLSLILGSKGYILCIWSSTLLHSVNVKRDTNIYGLGFFLYRLHRGANLPQPCTGPQTGLNVIYVRKHPNQTPPCGSKIMDIRGHPYHQL